MSRGPAQGQSQGQPLAAHPHGCDARDVYEDARSRTVLGDSGRVADGHSGVVRLGPMAVAEKSYKNYVAGEWVDARSGETFESLSPATGETIGTFPRSSVEDVDLAVAAAKAAYENWRLTPAPRRGEILFRFGQLLTEHKEDIAQLMAREMGKVIAEARGDVQ